MRKLNGFYAIEVLNGRLNGSSDKLEKNTFGFKNATFTKKVAGRSKVSAQCQKFNIKDFMTNMSGIEQEKRVKDGKQIKMHTDPFKYEIDDIFGFMLADKVEISKEEYDALNDEEKALYKKSKNVYQCNITKKRKSRLQMNALVNLSNRKVEWEWNVASSETDSMPYQQEVYSGVHTSIFNLDIEEIGKFIISNNPSEFRDYSEEEAKVSKVRDLTNEERLSRVKNVLNGIEHLSISGNQANHLTDTKPKFVILADYSWGNNAFQGVLKEDGVDLEMLEECINQNEKFRLSKIYIGVNKFFDSRYNDIKEKLEGKFSSWDFVEISDVKTAFENYKIELESNM